MGFSTNQNGFWKGQPPSADPAKRQAVTTTLAANATAVIPLPERAHSDTILLHCTTLAHCSLEQSVDTWRRNGYFRPAGRLHGRCYLFELGCWTNRKVVCVFVHVYLWRPIIPFGTCILWACSALSHFANFFGGQQSVTYTLLTQGEKTTVTRTSCL